MAKSHYPLAVWLYAPADLHRLMYALASDLTLQKGLTQKFTHARKLGVDGIIVPISWRIVAPFHPDNANDAKSWRGYRMLFELLRSAGLNIIPEFNFATSGLSDVRQQQLMPDWFWGYLPHCAAQKQWPQDCLKYVDSAGRDNIAAPSPWASELYLPFVGQWLKGFFQFFEDFAAHVPHIMLGVGPEGELRHPLLKRHGKPVQLPVFSALSKADLEQQMRQRYGSKKAWYEQWQVQPELSTGKLLEQVQQEFVGLYGHISASEPFQLSSAAKGFFDWYQGVLISHAKTCVGLVDEQVPAAWQTSLGLRLPTTFSSQGSEQDQRVLAAFAGLQLSDQPDQEFDFFSKLLDGLGHVTQRALRLNVTGLEHAKHSHRVSHWLTQLKQLDLPIIAENAGIDALAEHPTWDSLIQRVTKQPTMAGWALRDLNSALDRQSAGPFRLRQLAHLKHGGSADPQQSRKIFRVMGPLHLKVANQKLLLQEENWAEFEAQIKKLRGIGVSAISTDLWWGLIEGPQPDVFDWSYYDRMLEVLAAHDMHWVPILSFHQAGGNVNDDFMQTIPLWLWGKILVAHPELESVRDLQYVSESGDSSMEYMSLWADQYVLPYYRRFMEAFAEHYRAHAHLIDEINISLGPAGELRYPSYNAHDWGNYPNRGTLQCYSRPAQQDWLNYLSQKYRSPEAMNYALGTQVRDFSEVAFPEPEELFNNKQYMHSALGREFLYWYQQALVNHGKTILQCAATVFSGPMSHVPLGIKVPGIHWEVSDPAMPRAAEITAGLIAPHANMGPQNNGEYARLLEDLIPKALRSRVVLHFTCLEMINKDYEGYSRAEDLVNWMADAAAEVGVSLMGENALAGELYGKQGWAQITRALERQPGFGGITLLRLQNLFDDHPLPLQQLKALINREQ
ncbi:family 14 glycosylhydrolase [Neiella marina]|uniref:Beta-amylase n=1 Tax=Neiella holothuriorum TaxID=2870530 RepID=A0ABS7EBB5_9GAMM|nr:family 14 glycosylhydrolase [Neiella holothuriorum]MBW8189617.1 family 14 glycosylhydrolase [Neiella holothuriorum]